ncbi:MAG TPA: sensor histidine kinase [Firmicutes bacterium]|nr:sensor histidine kinase [Bacillota bacterium]
MSPTLKAISHLFLSEARTPDFPPSPPSRQGDFDPERIFAADLLFPNQGEWEQILQWHRLCRALVAGLRVYLESAGRIAVPPSGGTAVEEPSRRRSMDGRLELLERIADGLEGTRESVDLRRVIQEAAEETRERFARRRVRYIETLPERLPPVRGIRALLGELLEHLLCNSLEAIPETATPGEVRLSAGYTPRDVFLTVGDSGEGLSAETLARMFFPFFSTRRSAGLGLFWVSRIVELHHGRLKLWSRPGLGTEIYLRLPVDG